MRVFLFSLFCIYFISLYSQNNNSENKTLANRHEQSPKVNQIQQTIIFEHSGDDEGLSENLLSVVQDEKGFIWIAANNGLYRFDGIEFKKFQIPKKGIKKEPILWINKFFPATASVFYALTFDNNLLRLDTQKEELSLVNPYLKETNSAM